MNSSLGLFSCSLENSITRKRFMKPWEIVAQEDLSHLEGHHRLILLRSPFPMDPYKIYGLIKRAGSWVLVDKFLLSGTTGTEAPDWAFRKAWPQFQTHQERRHPVVR